MGWNMFFRNYQRSFLPSRLFTISKANMLILSFALGPVLGSGVALANDGEEVSDAVSSSFTCELLNGEYTVMYRPQSEPGQAYPWAVPIEMGGGWTPQRRCETISSRLEDYRPDRLVELRTDVENGYNTVCATTEENLDSCRIVFTVPPGQDPLITRDAVFANITLADSGTSTNAVNTFIDGTPRLPGTDLLGSSSWENSISGTLREVLTNHPPSQGLTSSDGINLKPHLDPADGGTGAYLK